MRSRTDTATVRKTGEAAPQDVLPEAYHQSLFPPVPGPSFETAEELERVWGARWGANSEVGALAGDNSADRGLHFICLNANIQRQFEFVNHTWLNNPKFADLYDDADPLVAPSAPHGGTFTMPTEGVRERVTNVPRFVTVRGGAYFLLPGLAALRYLAK